MRNLHRAALPLKLLLKRRPVICLDHVLEARDPESMRKSRFGTKRRSPPPFGDPLVKETSPPQQQDKTVLKIAQNSTFIFVQKLLAPALYFWCPDFFAEAGDL